MKYLILLLMIFLSCSPYGIQKQKFVKAKHNFSSFDIMVDYSQIPSTCTLVFFNDKIKDLSGCYLSTMHIQVESGDLIILDNVLVIDVYDCWMSSIPLTRIITHELVHHTQHMRSENYEVFLDSLNAYNKLGSQYNPYELEAGMKQRDVPIIAYIVGPAYNKDPEIKFYSIVDDTFKLLFTAGFMITPFIVILTSKRGKR